MNATSTKERKPMSSAARAARNAYMREWAKRNPDKRREAIRRYWKKKAAERAAAENRPG